MSGKPDSDPSVTPFAVIKVILVMIGGLVTGTILLTVFGLLSTTLLWKVTTKLGPITVIILLVVIMIRWVLKPKR